MAAEVKHLFLLNPTAGKQNRTMVLREQIEALGSARDVDYRIEVTQCRGHAEELTREAAERGDEVRIYACGGDGTLNEVVNAAAGYANAAVTMVPCGSGNDFVRLFSEPSAFSDLGRLMEPDEVRFDVVRVNDRLGLGVCSVGLDARIGTDVARYKHLPLVSGSGAYVLSIVANLFRGIDEHYRVEMNGEVLDGQYTLACVCNGSWYGGGFHPVPEANPADGLLDVLLVDAVSLLTVPRVIGKYKDGRYAELPQYIRHYQCRELTVQADRLTTVNLDGELMKAERVHFRVEPGRLRFFYPKGLHGPF